VPINKPRVETANSDLEKELLEGLVMVNLLVKRLPFEHATQAPHTG
jgi:hypothetical protein